MYELHTQIEVAAAAPRVWQVLTAFDAYPEWNRYLRRIRGELRVGARLTVNAHAGHNAPSEFQPVVLRVEPDRGFAWLGTYIVPGLLDGEHSFAIEPLGAGRCRFVHREQWRGLLWRIHRRYWLQGLRVGFEAMNLALKKRVEEPPPEGSMGR